MKQGIFMPSKETVINKNNQILEGYGNDNCGAKSQGIKHVIPDLLEQ